MPAPAKSPQSPKPDASPAPPALSTASIRRRPDVARIVRAWRELTTPASARRIGPGERTLVACSGGADSCALLLALATAPGAKGRLVVGHIVHDLRPETEALADRDAARALADALGLEFVEASISVRQPPPDDAPQASNLEARAREQRYAALAALAASANCRYLATGHHAEDQLETVLMALLRGAGPRGLGGIAVKRAHRLAGAAGKRAGVWIIRPLLGDPLGRVPPTMRAEAEDICRAAGWGWRTDATNADRALLRNALRHEVLPVLARLRPQGVHSAVRSAAVARASSRVLRARARDLWAAATDVNGKKSWDRAALRREPVVVIGELMRLAARRLNDAGTGRDRLSRRAVAPALAAIADGSTDPRRFRVGGLELRITSRTLTVEAAGQPEDD